MAVRTHSGEWRYATQSFDSLPIPDNASGLPTIDFIRRRISPSLACFATSCCHCCRMCLCCSIRRRGPSGTFLPAACLPPNFPAASMLGSWRWSHILLHHTIKHVTSTCLSIEGNALQTQLLLGRKIDQHTSVLSLIYNQASSCNC